VEPDRAVDHEIQKIHRDDPRWAYEQLAGVVGCRPELIAVITRQEGL
jgi:hypothetical protein